jgi:hypothetical protein
VSPIPQSPLLPLEDQRNMYNNSSGDGEIDTLGDGLANSSLEDGALHKIVVGVDFGTTYTGKHTGMTAG